MVDANHKPPPHPFYGDSWERGVDPWHVDAFIDGLEWAAESLKSVLASGIRKEGWFLIDGGNNAIAFVPDHD